MPELPVPFADALAAQRESLNQRFALRLRAGARIDPDAFLIHLREAVGPLVLAIHRQFPERVALVVNALYDASLDLFAASLIGPNGKLPSIRRVWTDLLPSSIPLLAREPTALVGCLCNALCQVAQQRGANADLWLIRMQAVQPQCSTLIESIDAGLVAAWQAGMVQYREPALVAAARLPTPSAAIALGLSGNTEPEILRATIRSLQKDRWFRIAGDGKQPRQTLSPVAVAGAFSGFGGLFPRPPIVSCVGGQLVVSVGDGVFWHVIADAYGVWFRRIKEARLRPARLPREISTDAQGTVRWGQFSCPAPQVTKVSGIACDGVTLAITIPTSHHLFLFARTGGSL